MTRRDDATAELPPASAEADPLLRIAALPGPDLPSCLLAAGGALYVGTAAGADGGRGRIWRLPRDGADTPAPVFEGAEDDAVTALTALPAAGEAPALFAATQERRGGRVLREVPGNGFVPVSDPGLGDPARRHAGPLAAWRGQLVVAAATAPPEDPGVAGGVLLAGPGTPGGGWRALAEPGFGDADNGAVAALLADGDTLLAGTANHVAGFQLWQVAADGEWIRCLTGGAARYAANAAADVLARGAGEVLLGARGADPVPGHDPLAAIDPGAPELIALGDDGDWQVIAGAPRFSPDGLKLPVALAGPGFDAPDAARLAAILAHGDAGLAVVLAARPPAAGRLLHSADGGESFAGRPAPGPVLAAEPVSDSEICLAVAEGAGAALYLWRPF